MKRIVIATGLYPPDIGGPATYARMLEEHLPAHGFVVEIVPFGKVRHHHKLVRHLLYARELFRISKDVDCIYALDPISVGLPAWLVARLRRKKFLLRLGGDYAWEQGRQRYGVKVHLDEFAEAPYSHGFMTGVLYFLQSFVATRALYVVTPSNYLAGIVSKWGVTTAKLKVIYSALFPLAVHDTKEQLRQQLRYTSPTIVSAGRLVPWKGFTVLLKVVAELKKTYPTLSLVIVGSGPEEERLYQETKKLGLEETVRFTGSLSKEALGGAIKAADVFVLNTGYEGLSHQLLEVMDLGVPIVTTRVGGNPELIQNGVDGLLVPYNQVEPLVEAIDRVLKSEATQKRFSEMGRVRVKSFSQEKTIQNIANLLNSV